MLVIKKPSLLVRQIRTHNIPFLADLICHFKALSDFLLKKGHINIRIAYYMPDMKVESNIVSDLVAYFLKKCVSNHYTLDIKVAVINEIIQLD